MLRIIIRQLLEGLQMESREEELCHPNCSNAVQGAEALLRLVAESSQRPKTRHVSNRSKNVVDARRVEVQLLYMNQIKSFRSTLPRLSTGKVAIPRTCHVP